jgi:hypothetical protein
VDSRARSMRSRRLFELTDSADGGGPWEDPEELRSSDFQARASASGADFKLSAIEHLQSAGALVRRRSFRRCQLPVDAEVEGTSGRRILVLSRGTHDDTPTSGLRRLDTVQKVGFVAVILASEQSLPVLIVTSHLPRAGTGPAVQLAKVRNHVADVVATTGDLAGYQRLLAWLHGEPPPADSRTWAVARDPGQLDFGWD